MTVFTDAEVYKLPEIMRLENIHRSENKPDILDILLMSRSQVLILSQSSTFSYWSAFLSDALVVLPENDWQNTIRGHDFDDIKYNSDKKIFSEILHSRLAKKHNFFLFTSHSQSNLYWKYGFQPENCIKCR